MPNFANDEYKFPDEQIVKDEDFDKLEIEVEDDTPEEDRGRAPMPRTLVEELESDDLEKYDGEVKQRLKQMRKVWHDERRAKEEAYREQQEAIAYAQRLREENATMRKVLDSGGKQYAEVLKNAATMELDNAKRAYKEAYDSGDSDRLVEAQEELQKAQWRLMSAQNLRPPALQQENSDVKQQHQEQPRPVDRKLMAWHERNQWYGPDDEMTAAALGIHEKLRKGGEVEVGSDEYYAILDKTIRKRFPERFESEASEDKASRTRSATVVAPAVRSTAPNRVRLKSSQVSLAKKLGLTPEQYALELRKLENQNG